MNTLTLDQARSALNKAHDIYQARMLDIARDQRTPQWDAAYYSSSSRKSFVARFEAFFSSDNLNGGRVQDAFSKVSTAWANYDDARLVEKNRKAEKRVAVAAKKNLREELNLQEGVKLAGVDVGQYKVILAGLEPVRLHVLAARRTYLDKVCNTQAAALASNGWDKLATYPEYHNGKVTGYAAAPEHFNLFFVSADRHDTNLVKPAGNIPARIEKVAQQFALAYVQGYAVKLAQKTGELIANDVALEGFAPVEAWVTSKDLWANSTAYIRIEDARKAHLILTFHTQIIWNRSCLGKVFNQYPTRRVD